ncbi:MAG: radical SAM protein [Pseudomonadota bacterium]
MNIEFKPAGPVRPLGKFEDPDITAKGEPRARVPLTSLETLWINTGTLCNIQCVNCYIESSPTNDRLVYFSASDARDLFDEIDANQLGTREIGFTGGEPFMNPDMLAMLDEALSRGFEVLVLTNAMQPMMRPGIQTGLIALNEKYGRQLTLRVSLDHFTKELHETERGKATWDRAIAGLDWLAKTGIRTAIAGRTCWNETDAVSRAGFAELIVSRGWAVDPEARDQLVLLPEMDGGHDVPEITTACWKILGKRPSEMMCATSRMVVKRKGDDAPTVLPCTLLPYDDDFSMGQTLTEASSTDGGMFAKGAVKLCHSNCAKFCVLGGGTCS